MFAFIVRNKTRLGWGTRVSYEDYSIMSNLHRSKDWRKLLDSLMTEQGVDLEYVADYIGAPYNGKETVFYAKVPQKRLRFIGIGMALKQPLSVINQWISDYSNNRMLYVKDVTEDLIWIYLIGLNCSRGVNQFSEPDKKGSANQSMSKDSPNYFKMFDQCQEAALMTYRQLWDEITLGSLDTSDMEIELQKISYDDTFIGLKQFIVDHMDSFKTAYSKPRRMLDRYVNCILRSGTKDKEHAVTLNSLRGHLDDSMINYLSGDSETIHTMDRRRPVRVVSFKQVPKNRKTHISLCLALGMTASEIDQYLQLMGYAPLKSEGDEGILIKMLTKWDKKRPLQREYKAVCFSEPSEIKSDKDFSLEQERKAVQEMLYLRRDLQEEYKKQGLIFPYG